MSLRKQILVGTIFAVFLLIISLLLIGATSLSDARDELLYNPPSAFEAAKFSMLEERMLIGVQMVDAEFDHYLLDVNLLRDFYEERLLDSKSKISVTGLNVYQDGGTFEWPGYGYIHPIYGTYADFDLRGEGSPWLPKRIIDRSSADLEFKKIISGDLDDVMAMTPIFASIYSKYQSENTLDLVWIVLDSGASNVYPPYDYLSIISYNPSIIDSNESEKDYVRLLNSENNPERKTMWLKPYYDDYRLTWMVSVVAPIYDGDQFLGTIGIDILLPSFISKIESLAIIGSNYVFLLDRDGSPLALSQDAIDSLIIDQDSKRALLESLKPRVDQHWTGGVESAFDLSLEKMIDDPMLSLIYAMEGQDHGILESNINGEAKVVSFVTIPGLDWLIVTVLPYEIVTGLVLDYGIVASVTANKIIDDSWIILLFTSLFILLFSFWSYRTFVDPIIDLMREVNRLSLKQEAMNEIDPLLINRKDEIGSLAMTINSVTRELKDSEDKYSVLVENSNDGIVVLRNDKILFANDRMAKMLGHKSTECIGMNFSHCIVAQDRKHVVQSDFLKIQKIGAGSRFECNLLNVAKIEVPVEINASQVYYEKKPAVLMMIRDMTRYKETEKLRNDFTSIASHQMRTPLTGIKWFVELLLTDKVGKLSNKQKDYLEQIQNSNEKMIALIDDMLSVSRIESADKFKVLLKKQDIVKVFHLAIKNSQESANKKGIIIHHRNKCIDRLIVEFDKDKLLMVLQNILDNAIKYSPDKSVITFESSVGNNQITLSVTDHGAGIPQKQQGQVFHRFFRAENTAENHSGTGLGLYIAKFLMEKQNGKIWFESVEGQGSTFYISLPIKK